MSALAGRAATLRQVRASAPTQRAAAVLVAPRQLSPSPLTPTPTGQASACQPKQPARAVRWLVATAEMARTDREPLPEVKPSRPPTLAARGSRASTDRRQPRILFNPAEGLSMEKTARALLRAPTKFVLVASIRQNLKDILGMSHKPLIMQCYTLCEVSGTNRQSVPPRKPAFLRRQNRPVLARSFNFCECHENPGSGSVRPCSKFVWDV